MEKVLFALIVVILLNIFPYFIGYRDYNQTIINYIRCICIYTTRNMVKRGII